MAALSLQLPAQDRMRSPYTGLTREHWCGYADHLLRSAHRHATEDHANIYLPGAVSAYGRRSDSLEAFARTFLMAAFRIAGDPQGTGWIAEWYAKGFDAGTDPRNPDRWPTPGELGQAKVEAASLAVGLALTREQLWDKLPQRVQEQMVAWFETVIGEEYPPINWVWFQIVVETFLETVGGRSSAEDIEQGLAIHDSLYRGHGWFADGPERAYDHYIGWAFHVYPQLWAMMAPKDSRVLARGTRDGDRLADYLDDFAYLVGANGAPLIQGRSLIYRFAAAASFWIGELSGHTRLDPGVSRRGASGMLDYFVRHGAIDSDGLLSIGWHGEFPGMKQSYSGFGSPYWAAKGMLGLALPADHRAWTAVEQPLPVERGDTQRLLHVPGWQVNGTAADGVVRVHNHGTDHARQGDRRTDSALYARLGYSTHSFPDLVSESPDNSVVLVDGDGRLTHRTGFLPLGLRSDGDALVGASLAVPNWITVSPGTGPDHGSGAGGTAVSGPDVTTVSVTRGPVEVRIVRVRGAGGSQPARLRIGGWPVDPAPAVDQAQASSQVVGRGASPEPRPGPVADPAIVSLIRRLEGWGLPLGDSGAFVRDETQPMGSAVSIPWVGTSGPVADGDYAAVVGFGGEGTKEAFDAVRLVRHKSGEDTSGQDKSSGPDGGERLEFVDGTSVNLARLLAGLG